MDQAVIKRPPRQKANLRIAIVGAGFGGIGLAIALRRAGFAAITVFEKGDRIGGTWRDNSYPGAACDVPSHLYSFSFAPKADWSHKYSRQAEILDYLDDVAARFGVASLVRLRTAVSRADFDETAGVWWVETADGGRAPFDVFIPALGQLSTPSVPDFPGLASFAGPVFHSAAWDHSVPLDGRRIGIVGSAASAVQIVPELAKIAARVTVFQRTPNWIIARNNAAYGDIRRRLFAHLPFYRFGFRLYQYLYQEFLYDAFRTGSKRNAMLKGMALEFLASQVRDPVLRAKLTPTYELGCKRLLVSDDFLASFNRPGVELVTSHIDHVEPNGVRTQDGTLHEMDLLVMATGFDVRNCLAPVAITGRHGQDLQQRWRDGPAAYRGVAVPGFPNMFLSYGPNTNLGHNSIIIMLECQANYIVQCLERLVAADLDEIEVSEAAHTAYNERMQRELAATVWSTGCGSWYGQGGRITANWYGSTLEYGRQMKHVVFGDFEETVRDSAAARTGAIRTS